MRPRREKGVWDLTLWFPFIFMLRTALTLYSLSINFYNQVPSTISKIYQDLFLHATNCFCFSTMHFMQLITTILQALMFWPLFYHHVFFYMNGRALRDIISDPRNNDSGQPKLQSRLILRTFTQRNKSYLHKYRASLMIFSAYQLQGAYSHAQEDTLIES